MNKKQAVIKIGDVYYVGRSGTRLIFTENLAEACRYTEPTYDRQKENYEDNAGESAWSSCEDLECTFGLGSCNVRIVKLKSKKK